MTITHQSALTTLRERPERIAGQAAERLRADGVPLDDARVLILGAACEPGVPDVRESPALRLLGLLAARGADVRYSDGHVPRLTLDGQELWSVTDPHEEPWDLVIVHTVHPGDDLGWLDTVPQVLDTRYRLRSPAPAPAPLR
ncbi:UDP binding domain-containing protein [Streptomyces sp. NPDC012751]|uniref:UDP binding domain-containing protein n=1 Tax=Streptomyces sp. NPDC012751 TaxID=3364846 RepID=UPI003684CDDB